MLKKVLLIGLTALTGVITSCSNHTPKDLEGKDTKEFWLSEATKLEDPGFSASFAKCLAEGEIIVKEATCSPMSGLAIHSDFLTASVVTPAKDTIAEMVYLKEFMIFNDEHKSKTGEESESRQLTRLTLVDPGWHSTTIIKTETATEKTNGKLIQSTSLIK